LGPGQSIRLDPGRGEANEIASAGRDGRKIEMKPNPKNNGEKL
jgi:hypothetical protein